MGGIPQIFKKLPSKFYSEPCSASDVNATGVCLRPFTRKAQQVDSKRLNVDLVFVQYNLQLLHKKVEATSEELIDLDEIDPYSEWTGKKRKTLHSQWTRLLWRERLWRRRLAGLRGGIGLDDILEVISNM